MKKIISIILSIALSLGLVTAVNAAVTEINDGLGDASKMISSSDNLIFETKKLGSYQNAEYVTSNVGEMEIIYELEGMASFEVVTLNYNNTENIAFYMSETENGEYTEIEEFTSSEENLGSNWVKTTYSANNLQVGSKYLKIIINQTKAKYIRLDNVKILAKFELLLEDYEFSADGEAKEGENLFGVDSLKLTFNQKVEFIPELLISAEGEEDIKVRGAYGEDNSIVVYEFEALGFDLYTFTAEGFESSTATLYDFESEMGYKVESAVPDKIYFGDSFLVSDFVKSITDKDGNQCSVPDIMANSENPDVISVEDGKLVLRSPGTAKIQISFLFDEQYITIKKDIVLCGAKGLLVPSKNVSLDEGGFESFPINITLTDGSDIPAESITVESTDSTVAVYENGMIKGISEGNTYIKITVDYYGTVLTETISVGVGKEALDTISKAEVLVNRDTISVDESIQLFVSGYFENDTGTDSVAMKKEFYSTNEAVLTVSDSGKATGKSAGTAGVYAVVTLGGISVKSNAITITVEEKTVYKANLLVENCFMLSGVTSELKVKAYTVTGEEIENPQVSYKTSDADVLKLSDNIITAAKDGTASVYATVTYNGKSVDTEKLEITVKNSNGSLDKNFLNDANFNNVFDHSNGLSFLSGGGCLTKGTDLHNQYVLFEATKEIKNIYIRWDSYGKNITGDIRLQVSADNSEFTEIPESEISIKEVTCHVVSSGQGYIFEYSGEKLQGMKYVKIFVDRMQGNTQITRLLGVRLDYDNAPEVIGVTGFNKENQPTNSSDAIRLAISFSQTVDSENPGTVILTRKTTGKAVDFVGSLENAVYTLGFDKLENETYTLTVSGFKNVYGTEMEKYNIDIKPIKDSIEVKNVTLNGTKVMADIVNNSGDTVDACVVTAVYNSKGVMTGVYTQNVQINSGTNSFVSGGEFANGENAKVYIWNNMVDMIIYK